MKHKTGICAKQKKASSISIIGGAAGPTSIFVAGKTEDFIWPLVASIVCLFGLAAVLYPLVKNKKKKR